MVGNKLAKRIGIGIAAFVVVGLIAAVVITGYIVYSNTTQLVSNDLEYVENSMEYFAERGFDYAGFLGKYSARKIELPSSKGEHMIPGDLYYSADINNDTVILIHGLGGNRMEILPFAPLFLENGLNVLVYDQRSSGGNLAPYTTFGYLESYDTADYVAYLDGIIGKDKNIHIWGASAGAATAAISASRGIVSQRVASLILDSPVSCMEDVLRMQMGEMNIGIPLDFLIFSGNLYTRLALGFSYADASAVESLKQCTLPVLILASKADVMTPFYMAENMRNAASYSTLVSVEDSAHIRLFRDYPDWYEEQVVLFLNEVMGGR